MLAPLEALLEFHFLPECREENRDPNFQVKPICVI